MKRLTAELLAESETILDRRQAGRPRKNPVILCGCGCGGQLRRFDAYGRSRKFLKGHRIRPAAPTPEAAMLAALDPGATTRTPKRPRPPELVDLAEVAARWDVDRATDAELTRAAERVARRGRATE